MSWCSEHLLEKPLPNGKARGGVCTEDIPPQSPENDVKMRKRRTNYYGSTKFGDDQIVYFFLKHNGNCWKAGKDIGYKKPSSFEPRARKTRYNGELLIKPNDNANKTRPGRKGKYTKEEYEFAVALSNGSVSETAKLLGVYPNTVRVNCNKHGIRINSQNGGNRQTRLTRKEAKKIIACLIECKGNVSKSSRKLKTNINAITYKVARIHIIEVLGFGKYHE